MSRVGELISYKKSDMKKMLFFVGLNMIDEKRKNLKLPDIKQFLSQSLKNSFFRRKKR